MNSYLTESETKKVKQNENVRFWSYLLFEMCQPSLDRVLVLVCVCVCIGDVKYDGTCKHQTVCSAGSMHRIGVANSCEHEPERTRTSTFWRCCPCDVIVLHPNSFITTSLFISKRKTYYFCISQRSLRLAFLSPSLSLSLSLASFLF